MQNAVKSFVDRKSEEIKTQVKLNDLYENSLGRYNRTILPFSMKNVRKLPIVGDVYNERKQWPETAEDW